MATPGRDGPQVADSSQGITHLRSVFDKSITDEPKTMSPISHALPRLPPFGLLFGAPVVDASGEVWIGFGDHAPRNGSAPQHFPRAH
jgi:hypothetical protein